MSYRLARATLMGLLLVGLTLLSSGGVAAQPGSGADLAISISGPTRVKSKALAVYTVTVTNNGPETATGITIMGSGGDQFDQVSMQCQNNGSFGQSSCAPGDMAPGATVTATYTVSVCCLVRGESRAAFVDASVSQAVPDPNPGNDFAQLDVFIIGGHVK